MTVFACKSGPGERPDAPYPFRSGRPVDMAAVSRAITFAHGAAHQMTIARIYDGRSDLRRDEALTEARTALVEALAALDAATQPEPPRIPPIAMPAPMNGLHLAAEILGVPMPKTEAA